MNIFEIFHFYKNIQFESLAQINILRIGLK